MNIKALAIFFTALITLIVVGGGAVLQAEAASAAYPDPRCESSSCYFRSGTPAPTPALMAQTVLPVVSQPTAAPQTQTNGQATSTTQSQPTPTLAQSGATNTDAHWYAYTMYPVQKGDTLESVSQRFSVPVDLIKRASNTNCDITQFSCFQRLPWVNVPIIPGSLYYIAGPKFTTGGADFMDVRRAVADGVNQLRTKNNMPPFTWDDTLAGFAQGRSLDMAARNYWGHYDPVTGASLMSVITYNGYVGGCENIRGLSNLDASLAVSGWTNSPPHRECILSSRPTVIGVGAAKSDLGVWSIVMIAAAK